MDNYFNGSLTALVDHASNELGGVVDHSQHIHQQHHNNNHQHTSDKDMSLGMSSMDNLYQHGQHHNIQQHQHPHQQQQHPHQHNGNELSGDSTTTPSYSTTTNNNNNMTMLSGNKRIRDRDAGDVIVTDFVNSVNNSLINNSMMSQQLQLHQHELQQHAFLAQQQQQQQQAQQQQAQHEADMATMMQHQHHHHHHHHHTMPPPPPPPQSHQLLTSNPYHPLDSHLSPPPLPSSSSSSQHHMSQHHNHHHLANFGFTSMGPGHSGSLGDILAAASMNVPPNGMMTGTPMMNMTPTSLTFNGVPLTHLEFPANFLSVMGNPNIPTLNTTGNNNNNHTVTADHSHSHGGYIHHTVMNGQSHHQSPSNVMITLSQLGNTSTNVRKHKKRHTDTTTAAVTSSSMTGMRGGTITTSSSNDNNTSKSQLIDTLQATTTDHHVIQVVHHNKNQHDIDEDEIEDDLDIDLDRNHHNKSSSIGSGGINGGSNGMLQQSSETLLTNTCVSTITGNHNNANNTSTHNNPSSHNFEVNNATKSLSARSIEEEHCIILERSTNTAAKCSNTRYQCKYCQFEFVGGPQKIRVHLTGKRENGTRLSKCINVPENVRKFMESRMKVKKKQQQGNSSNSGGVNLSSLSNDLIGGGGDSSGQDMNSLQQEEFDHDNDDDDDDNGPLVQGLQARNVEEQHCVVLARSATSSSKSSNSKYKCIYCRFRFVGGPQKIRVHLTGVPEGGTRVIKCTKAPPDVVAIMECRRKSPKLSITHPGFPPTVVATAANGVNGFVPTLASSTLLTPHNGIFTFQPNFPHGYGLPVGFGLALGGNTNERERLPSATTLINNCSSNGDVVIPYDFSTTAPNTTMNMNLNNNGIPSLIVASSNTDMDMHHDGSVMNRHHHHHDRSTIAEEEVVVVGAEFSLEESTEEDQEPTFDTLTALANTAMSNNIDVDLISTSSSSSSSSVANLDDDPEGLGSEGLVDDVDDVDDSHGLYNFDVAAAQLSDLHRIDPMYEPASGVQPRVYDILVASASLNPQNGNNNHGSDVTENNHHHGLFFIH